MANSKLQCRRRSSGKGQVGNQPRCNSYSEQNMSSGPKEVDECQCHNPGWNEPEGKDN